jgi:hypothetical protein
MRSSRAIAGFFVGAALLLPAVSFAATSADLNNQRQSLINPLIAILEQELHQILAQLQTGSGSAGP